MWMGKIGNKSASFINHKHFHPGNRENLEKVWLAEEKHKAELKRQKEMKEKLAEEIRITELKRQLREQEEQKYKQYLLEQKPPSRYDVAASSSQLLGTSAAGLILTKSAPESAQTRGKDAVNHKVVIRSRYREDAHENGHTSVFGSHYDRVTGRWGYRCCKAVKRGSKCAAATAAAKAATRERSAGKRDREDAPDTGQPKAAKQKRKGDLSMAETLSKLKKMEALD